MKQKRHWIKRYFFADIRENETIAQTILRTLGNVLRWALLPFALWLIVGAALEAVKLLPTDADKISYTLTYNLDECSHDAPLLLVVNNRSRKWFKSFNFNISAYEPSRSRDLSIMSLSSERWDFIIAPKQTDKSCYMHGKLYATELGLSELEWSVSNVHRTNFSKNRR